MIAVKELKTDRLVLKKITQNDLRDYIEWKSQQAYHEFLPSNPKTKEEYKKSIDAIIKGYQNKEKTALVWGIFLNNKLIGSVSIENLNIEDNSCEIGWGLNPKYQKQGYAFESVKCLVNHIFNTIKIDKILITIWDGNDSSKKLAEKLDFVLENIDSKARTKNDKSIDLHNYSLLKKDWNYKI